jgi:hypothetical protein
MLELFITTLIEIKILLIHTNKNLTQYTLSEHLKGCNCHPVIEGKPYNSNTEVILTGLDSEAECEACSA